MKQLFAAAALCALTVCGSAQAEVTTYDFTASVSTLLQWPAGPSQNSFEGQFAGSTVTVGDTLVGKLFIETAMTLRDDDGVVSQYWDLNSPTRFEYTLLSTGQRFSTTNIFNLNVFNNHPYDDQPGSYDLLSILSSDVGGLHGLVLGDDSATIFYSTRIPAHLSLYDFDQAEIITGYQRASDGAAIYMTADITSLSYVPAVPEPSTYLMMVAGLAIVGAGAWRGVCAGVAEITGWRGGEAPHPGRGVLLEVGEQRIRNSPRPSRQGHQQMRN